MERNEIIMQIIENSKVKEKIYIEKLENGLTIIIIPKQNTNKKYIIWGTHFGSIDNNFIDPETKEQIKIPDGVAHFLEHKLFEQENGTNSLDVLTNLGIEANAYTTNDHTAYLYECTNNFYKGLDEFMDYVQNPYFTDENVEKEKGIIGQEIDMYQDYPEWQVYINALKCLYENNPVKIDITGSKESINKITKQTLYTCYNTFYNPSNMALVVCGNFEPDKIIEEIKKRLKKKQNIGEIKRIYPEETLKINKKEIETKLEVNTPIYVIGIKDKKYQCQDIVKKHIAVEIILNMLIGKSSNLYKQLYKEGIIQKEPELSYEFSKEYAHILINGKAKEPKKVYEKIKENIEKYKKEGLEEEHFERIKKKIYGQYITEYNDVDTTATMFLSDYFKGINSFEYLEEYEAVTKEYTQNILKDTFDTENMIISTVTK